MGRDFERRVTAETNVVLFVLTCVPRPKQIVLFVWIDEGCNWMWLGGKGFIRSDAPVLDRMALINEWPRNNTVYVLLLCAAQYATFKRWGGNEDASMRICNNQAVAAENCITEYELASAHSYERFFR